MAMTNRFSPEMYWSIGPSFRDLEQYGIAVLTGESCSFGMRLLCDVNDDGRKLLSDFFGMPDISLSSNWNSKVGEKDATGSIVLSRGTLWDLMIFIAFYKERCTCLILNEVNGTIRGTYAVDSDFLDDFRSKAKLFGEDAYTKNNMWDEVWKPAPHNPSDLSNGGRNRHAFTGRTV